mmetsp:Transcript_2967/g.6786  ORF Transcript_2967/g.6786 Transcript_2967/m.6786 type:complete len:217 (+) Transcript_2967:1800-2450(+)
MMLLPAVVPRLQVHVEGGAQLSPGHARAEAEHDAAPERHLEQLEQNHAPVVVRQHSRLRARGVALPAALVVAAGEAERHEDGAGGAPFLAGQRGPAGERPRHRPLPRLLSGDHATRAVAHRTRPLLLKPPQEAFTMELVPAPLQPEQVFALLHVAVANRAGRASCPIAIAAGSCRRLAHTIANLVLDWTALALQLLRQGDGAGGLLPHRIQSYAVR